MDAKLMSAGKFSIVTGAILIAVALLMKAPKA